jgi:hypothetical protein
MNDDTLLMIDGKVRNDFLGGMIRWIKCIFKDCNTEDAIKDHESYLA